MPKPFVQQEFTFTNPDGSSFKVLGWGDQHYAVFETLDGYTLTRNAANGYFEYAELSPDKNSLISTGVRAEDAAHLPPSIPRHLRVRRASAKSTALRARGELAGRTRWESRREERRAVSLRAAAAAAEAAPPTEHTVGNYVGLCLLVQFPDVGGTIHQQEVTKFCNQKGYRTNEKEVKAI